MNKPYSLGLKIIAVLLLHTAVFHLLENRVPPLSIVAAVISSLANLLLLWLIGKGLFNNNVAFWTSFIYGISPWVAYLEMSGSIYISYLTILLLAFYLACRFSFLRIITLIIAAIIFFWAIPKTTFFSDTGLINNVNTFQGAAKKSQFSFVARFVENKYTYFGQRFTVSVLNYLTPTTYFTSNIKLLGWSFSPPILIGFLIPFLFGLPIYYGYWKKHKVGLSIPFLFLLPATLYSSPDLNRLILFSPIFFFTSAMGVVSLTESKKKLLRIMTSLIFILIVWQYLMVISDIFYSEPLRLLL